MLKLNNRSMPLVFPAIMAFLFLLSPHGISEINGPAAPDTPKIDSGAGEVRQNEFEASVEFAGGERREGVLSFIIDRVSFAVIEGGKKTVRSELLTGLKEISFLQWRGRERGKNTFVFYPHVIEIVLSDGSKLESTGGIPDFNKVRFGSGNRFFNYYSYFYDYFKDGKWVNSGSVEPGYPGIHPIKGVVIKIVFKKNEDRGQSIFRLLEFFK